jgi:hypothetical protein
MKKLVMVCLVVMAASAAQATTKVCGKLSSITTAPKCEKGEMCPHIIRVVEILTQGTGLQLELQTKSSRVLSKMNSLNGKTVCASGNYLNDAQFGVTSINMAKSAF